MRYEGSKADEAADRRGARKAGVSMAKWERSAADRKADAAARKRRLKKRAKR
jgi:hypothetical protein